MAIIRAANFLHSIWLHTWATVAEYMFPVQLKVDSVSDAESVLTYSYADYCWFYQSL